LQKSLGLSLQAVPGLPSLLGGQGYAHASSFGKLLRTAGVGGVEGGIYGAATDHDDRVSGGMSGAAMGAPLALVGAGVVNAVAKGGAGAASTALGRRVTDSAHEKARRAIIAAAEA
jgi:hypothetical protein